MTIHVSQPSNQPCSIENIIIMIWDAHNLPKMNSYVLHNI